MLVQLEDVLDHSVEEVAVVGHNCYATLEPADPVLEPREPFEVKVVGWLVQQEEIEAGEQHRRECGARPLTSGQGTHLEIEVCRKVQRIAHLGGPRIDVPASQCPEPLHSLGIRLDGSEVLFHAAFERVHSCCHRAEARTSQEIAHHGFVRQRVVLLSDEPNLERRGIASQSSRVGGLESREDAQQRRLACAVTAHDPEPGKGMKLNRDVVENELGAVMFGDANSGDANHMNPFITKLRSPGGRAVNGFSASSKCDAFLLLAGKTASIACEDSAHALGVLQRAIGVAGARL